MSRQALHWVFKVPSPRADTMKFYREVLGMKVLRHEEFEKGCEAACNGPYDGRWSKTMVGYGPEDDHFVVELTYNYNISSYKLGNDFQGITIQSSESISRARKTGWPVVDEGGHAVLEAPGGYRFYVIDQPQPSDRDPVLSVAIGVSNMPRSVKYWAGLLGMRVTSATVNTTALSYSTDQSTLVLVSQPTVEHAKAAGRIAFSVPASQLPSLQEKMVAADTTILTPLLALDTPGKATVEVVILADPDGQEICFVGAEAFKELSQVDPEGDKLLNAAIEVDKSDEWFKKKGRSKAEA
jgi:catechol 2,3-dioxygenase-like lactoylglutathione lyase family enzyme